MLNWTQAAFKYQGITVHSAIYLSVQMIKTIVTYISFTFMHFSIKSNIYKYNIMKGIDDR